MSKITIGLLAAATLAGIAGCRSASTPRVAVPDRVDGNRHATLEHDPVKPMPSQDRGTGLPVAPYRDEPLLSQRPPEQRAFVDAYERVGRPRIAVLVNPQLKAGAEDELAARAIDYTAMETVLADWFSAGGKVLLVSPTAARQRLSEQQMKDLRSGDPTVTRQIADELAADVLVQVQAQATRQAGKPAARIVAEAVNVRGGQSVGRAVVDVETPLQKVQINEYTRYLARKIMDDMAGTWNSMPAGQAVPLPPPSNPPGPPAESTAPTAPDATVAPIPPTPPTAPVAPTTPDAPVAPTPPSALDAPIPPSAAPLAPIPPAAPIAPPVATAPSTLPAPVPPPAH